MSIGQLTLKNVYPLEPVNGVRMDTTTGRKILFAGRENGGLDSYKYTDEAELVLADSKPVSNISGRMPGLDILNRVVMIPNINNPLGPCGVYSNSYDDSGLLTFRPPEINPGSFGAYDVALVQGVPNLAIVAGFVDCRTIEYDINGFFVNGYLDTVASSYEIRGVVTDMTPGRELVFLALNNGTVMVFKLNSATGILTYVTSDNRGALSGQAVNVDKTRSLLFFCAEDRTDVYKYPDSGMFVHSHEQPAFDLSEDIHLDIESQVAIVGDYGIYTYTYDDNGVMSGPISSFPLSGSGKGVALDSEYGVVVEGSGNNGIRTFLYEGKPPPTPVSISINHYSSIIARLPTGRAWRGQIMRAILKVIADKIQGITDELIIISKIKFLLFGEEIDETVRLNDELYTLFSTYAMIGPQTSLTGKLVIWEFILDLLGVGTIEDRIKAIISALINAGKISLIALEKALQDSGYDVYVHRNASVELVSGSKVTFNDTINFKGIIGDSGKEVRFVSEEGIIDPDIPDTELCVNFIDSDKDELKYRTKLSSDPRRWEYTFFIGGEIKLDRANVELSRKAAFRELILETKPMGMWAVLLIDYI